MDNNGNIEVQTTNGLSGYKAETTRSVCKKNKSVEESSVEDFLKSIFEMSMDEGLAKGQDRNEPVVQFKKPKELREILELEIDDQPQSHDELLKKCREVFRYSVKTGNPRFFNQLYAGLDPYGFAGQVMTDVLNTSIYTYEVAPVFVLMEQYLLKRFCNIVGYRDGNGTFPPGGSYSNMLGMNLARFRKFPDIKRKGLAGLPRMVAFASSASHYSNTKNASLLGLGSDSVISVKTDKHGKMDPADLEQRIIEAGNEGFIPFLVVATAGTTVLGAFDPINAIADLCQKYKIWLHVDASWGGGVLLSDKHRYLMEGVHRSDSIAWNPHKMLMAPLQCCMFITKHPQLLKECHGVHVPYLFQQDKTLYDQATYDVGSNVVQCGRKVDALKLWLMWKAHGNTGFRDRVDKGFENSRHLVKLVNETEGFRLFVDPECTNVCFWYVPESLRDTNWDLSNEEFCRKLATVAPTIKERMTEKGSMMVGYQPMGSLPNFFRMIVINDKVTTEDMEFVVREIAALGRDL